MDVRTLLRRMHRTQSLVLVACLIAACAPATTAQPSIELPSDEPTPGSTDPPAESPGRSPEVTVEPSVPLMTVRAYFILGSFVDNAGLAPVLRDVSKTEAVGSAAMTELLEGPNDDELGARPAMYTAVPDGTRFLGLTVDNGIATVNLSKEFEVRGGSPEVVQRLAQVVYTLTQFPTVTRVSFQIDGVPKPVFRGDGTTFDGPVGRDDYTDQLPAVFVDRPAWGGVLGTPARLVGVANVFEATFRAEIRDGAERTIASSPVTATCGTGCWGAFDVTIRYQVATAGWGTLRVFEPSAKDGTPTKTTEYPVWLTP
jgi:germination protein M